ncbi:fungal-specific transcription factor domain-containing protein [Phakopsora pachyrhizi]|nr:fungal-specific transcription factor domain-containing protein [Phakopsora pachyrhizi]
MHSQINRSNFSANLSSYFDPSTSIKQAFDEQISLKPLVPYSEDQASQPKRARQRSSRACDACRKHKVKCLLRENGTCQNCFAACKPCTFETVGVKRERPPTKRDVELLNRRIQELERILGVISPSLDLKSLPRTADQARSIVRIISSQSNKTLTKEPPEMERLDLADLISTLRILDEFSPASDQPDSDNCPSEEVTALARKLAQTLRFEIPSSCSVNYVEERLIGLASIAELPSPDLADSLIDLFFKNVNPFENLLHKAEFMRLYTSGLAQTSRSFRGLCFSVFAAGSRFSLDPRVFHSPGNKSFNAQAVGALFLFSGLDLLANDLSPFTLYDLQSSALLCYFTCCSCSPLTAWSCIASWIRRVQATGAHRENSPRWKVSMMTDQLRKRAVWYLAYMEVQVCKSLGRSLTIKAQEMDLELPLCIDDDTLSKIDSITFNKSPDAVNNLTNSNLDMLTGNPSQKIWNAIYSMRKKHGYLLQEFSYVKRPPDISTSSRATLTAFLADMDVSLEQCISGGEVYNNMDSPHEFLLNARLHL